MYPPHTHKIAVITLPSKPRIAAPHPPGDTHFRESVSSRGQATSQEAHPALCTRRARVGVTCNRRRTSRRPTCPYYEFYTFRHWNRIRKAQGRRPQLTGAAMQAGEGSSTGCRRSPACPKSQRQLSPLPIVPQAQPCTRQHTGIWPPDAVPGSPTKALQPRCSEDVQCPGAVGVALMGQGPRSPSEGTFFSLQG